MNNISIISGVTDNGGRRYGFAARQLTYTAYLPERRENTERRSGQDRRVDMAQRKRIARAQKTTHRFPLI
jgi:hypothetical protein